MSEVMARVDATTQLVGRNRLELLLFHLGDEFGFYNLEPVYNNCNFIWKSFCSGKYFQNNKKVKCIPIGYKSGVAYKSKSKRNFKWAFTGTPHKTSRHDLIFQLSNIKPFFCHKTKKFDKITKKERDDLIDYLKTL